MGLILLGSRNLADDQADQKPSVVARKKDTSGLDVPDPYIDIVRMANNKLKAVFYYYREFPTEEWFEVRHQYSLSEVDMSHCTIKSIGYQEFYDGVSHVEKLILPPHLESLGDSAMTNLGADTDGVLIVWPQNTLKEIGESCFLGCRKLIINALPDSIETIGASAFYYSGITISKLPSKLKTIGLSAFASTAITIDKVPDSVKSIGGLAFSGCTGIKNIEIGAKEMDKAAFSECSNLKNVWLRSSCETIVQSQLSNCPFFWCPADLKIYAEPDTEPAGWKAYYNYTSNPAVAVTVTFGQKTKPF